MRTPDDKFNIQWLVMGTALAAGIAFFGMRTYNRNAEAPPQKEFVCYDDGRLVERHVEVRKAYLYQGRTWYIEYTDSDNAAFFVQPEGETCQVEVVL